MQVDNPTSVSMKKNSSFTGIDNHESTCLPIFEHNGTSGFKFFHLFYNDTI